MNDYTTLELLWVALSVFLIGMAKGGLPVGTVALPVLVLVWPGSTEPAKEAVAFMLPVLCAADIAAVTVYRKHILWDRLMRLFPGAVLGVAAASVVFVSRDSAMLHVPDRWLKLCIGVMGLSFIVWQAVRNFTLKQPGSPVRPGYGGSTAFGFAAGVTSTLAHLAGPVLQMYLLPQKLPKMNFPATLAGFFFALNLIKLVPFALLGRIRADNLLMGARMIPAMLMGVGAGYLLVRALKRKHYMGFIYFVLAVTSLMLIGKASGLI
ncbi:MAG: sulfite exporter TauE/SafE family protein [Kiritimatiellia bacterium]